jgi:hypothetical protein
VACYSGHRGDETPRRFQRDALRVEIVGVDEQWLEPEYRYFRVRGGDSRRYTLRQHHDTQRWEVAAG